MRVALLWLLLVAVFIAMPSVCLASADATKAEKSVAATMGSDGIQRAEIVGGSYFFSPGRVTVKVHVPVELTVRKESGIVPHNMVMSSPEAGMEFDVAIHEEPQTIRFTPTMIGIYPFYCDKKLLFFESHREKGMHGTIEVVE